MTPPVTDAGKAHLEAIEAEREAKRETLRAERAARPVEVGDVVQSKALDADGAAAKWGTVVDATETDFYVLAEGDVTVAAHQHGRKGNFATRVGRLVRIGVADIDPVATVPRTPYGLGNAARKAILGAAAGGRGELTEDERALLLAGIQLDRESRDTQER